MATYQITVKFADDVSDGKAEMMADKIVGKALYKFNVQSDNKNIVDYKIEKI